MFRSIKEKAFKFAVSNIRNTSPISYRKDNSVTILTMVSHDTLDMYFLAIKSFIKNFGYGCIEAIDDGTLTLKDKELLNEHVPGINISEAKNVDTFDCPSYISWKRLFRAQELSKNSYVIQLDSDTVSVGPLVEVHEHVQNNTGFLTGSSKWSSGVSSDFLYDLVNSWTSDHVQARAERIFKEISFFKDGTRYLRGCAGFAGYPKNFASAEEIRLLSADIYSHIGEDWMKWGSEQTTTMCLISKCKDSKILPWPQYQNYGMPKSYERPRSMNLLHFLGTNRFDDGTYRRVAIDVIKKLS